MPCPISGMVQFLFVLVTLLLICNCVFVRALKIQFKPENVVVNMTKTVDVVYEITETDPGEPYELELVSGDSVIASIEESGVYIGNPNFSMIGSFKLEGNFLGFTKVYLRDTKTDKLADGQLDVTVLRQVRVIDKIFLGSVITLVSIIYINFGCALNWSNMMQTLKKPIGPVIGFCGQFLIMPVLSFALGKVLFPDNHALQLGMFFTGVSPAGGASNIWTVVLDGNMDLSVTMTTISTFAAFAMMPLWLFTLGKVIFDQAEVKVPYSQISYYAVALVIPLAIGFLISRYFKRIAQFLLFSWQIVVAGMGLPYVGYISAYLVAKILKQPPRDCLAIAIETGIQNTGIAIFLLKFCLTQPRADLTTVIPVSVAMMTPFPLMGLYIYKKIKERLSSTHKKLNDPGVTRLQNGFIIEEDQDKQRGLPSVP